MSNQNHKYRTITEKELDIERKGLLIPIFKLIKIYIRRFFSVKNIVNLSKPEQHLPVPTRMERNEKK